MVTRTVSRALSRLGGVCAKSTITRGSPSCRSIISIRPATPPKLDRASTTARCGTPVAATPAMAARALATLNRPIIGSRAGISPSGPWTVKVISAAPSCTSVARQSASLPSAEYVVHVRPPSVARGTSCSNQGPSSTLRTLWAARRTSLALSAKYCSIEPWKSRCSPVRLVHTATS